jgi:hypothetical protein
MHKSLNLFDHIRKHISKNHVSVAVITDVVVSARASGNTQTILYIHPMMDTVHSNIAIFFTIIIDYIVYGLYITLMQFFDHIHHMFDFITRPFPIG